MQRLFIAVTTIAALGACLDAPDDTPSPRLALADPTIDPNNTKIEDDPAFASQVARFTRNIAYLAGYADGERIWYWNVEGDNATNIAPVYRLIGLDGKELGSPIIDVIPGDVGYTPWWRLFTVKVTSAYAGERIWSRAGVEAGIELGLLEEPEAQDVILNCPVTVENMTVELGDGATASPTEVWYRNRRVYWIRFSEEFDLPVKDENMQPIRTMPSYPVYVLQRINEALPLYEFVTQVDITGDDLLNDSNNIFASGLDGPRYSPLWYSALVRTSTDYLSIDSPGGGTVGLSAESQFVRPEDGMILSTNVVRPVERFRDAIINCPIQRTKGEL